MDFRRAADPRLARDPRRPQDPRLQRAASADPRARSDSPLPAPPVNTTVATTHAPQPLNATAPQVLSESIPVKQKPLFCVVCASNQVFCPSLIVSFLARMVTNVRKESLYGGALRSEVRKHIVVNDTT